MLKTVLAVLAGFAVMGMAGIGTDIILGRLVPDQFGPGGTAPSTGMLGGILAYTMVYCALGGYVTAAIDKDRPLRAAAILAILIGVLTIANLVMTPGTMPLWWKIAGGALSGPFAYAGGYLRARR